MDTPTPAFILFNSELAGSTAPWCTWLDNLELAMLLLAQPWIAGDGLRRAELGQLLGRLGSDLPLGPIYFQRINRCTATLEGRGQMRVVGAGRNRRFQTTTKGLAAMLLNLQVHRADPTIDGSEFELKRALISLWNLVVERLFSDTDAAGAPPESGVLLDELGALRLWGRQIITDQVVIDAFDILRFIRTQRLEVDDLRHRAEARRSEAAEQAALLSAARCESGETPRAAALEVASGAAPQLQAATQILRYEAFLKYLDGLSMLYETGSTEALRIEEDEEKSS